MPSSGGRNVCRPFYLVLSFSPSLQSYLLKLERCQSWFLKHIFYVPSFTPGPILLKMPGLNYVTSEVVVKELFFLGRLITEPNRQYGPVRNLFQGRTEGYFDTNVTSAGVLLNISEAVSSFRIMV